MHIRSLRLPTADVVAALRFYRDVLELPVSENSRPPQIMVGSTVISLVPQHPESGAIHLAFTIPSNRVEDGLKWLSERLQPLSINGAATYKQNPPWDSESIYFRGPDGIVLEFIARHPLDNASERQFSSADLLCVSEAGIAVADPIAAAAEACAALGVAQFGARSEHYAAVGNNDGLLVFVRRGHPWLPTADALAVGGPAAILCTHGASAATLNLEGSIVVSTRSRRTAIKTVESPTANPLSIASPSSTDRARNTVDAPNPWASSTGERTTIGRGGARGVYGGAGAVDLGR